MVVVEERKPKSALAQQSLVPLGACWKMEMWDCRMVDMGGRTLTAGEEADGIREEKGAEAGETEAGVVAKATTALVAEAPDVEVL